MALRNCFEQRLASKFLVFLDQNVRAHGTKTSFVRIELDAESLFAGSIIQTESDIRMSIVPGDAHQSASAGRDDVVPTLQVLRRPSEKVCEHQIGIAAVGPEPIKEHHRRIYPPRVRKQIVNFYAVNG